MSAKVRLAVLISGGGTNLQSIIDAGQDRKFPVQVVLVVSSRDDAFGLTRAKNAGIDTAVYSRKSFPDGNAADDWLLALLDKYGIQMIALAGYLKMVSPAIIRKYRGKIVNIHPGLLPKYGGKGMYGQHVHEAVIAAGEKETGVTIHQVDEIYDHGLIVAEQRVPVLPGETAEELAARVLRVEHQLYPRVLGELAERLLKEKGDE